MSETKAELNDKVDEISDLIDAALDAELSREKVIGKIKEMRDVVESEEEDEDPRRRRRSGRIRRGQRRRGLKWVQGGGQEVVFRLHSLQSAVLQWAELALYGPDKTGRICHLVTISRVLSSHRSSRCPVTLLSAPG